MTPGCHVTQQMTNRRDDEWQGMMMRGEHNTMTMPMPTPWTGMANDSKWWTTVTMNNRNRECQGMMNSGECQGWRIVEVWRMTGMMKMNSGADKQQEWWDLSPLLQTWDGGGAVFISFFLLYFFSHLTYTAASTCSQGVNVSILINIHNQFTL
jgi:hypothetical protein